jgi:hypothetical protein
VIGLKRKTKPESKRTKSEQTQNALSRSRFPLKSKDSLKTENNERSKFQRKKYLKKNSIWIFIFLLIKYHGRQIVYHGSSSIAFTMISAIAHDGVLAGKCRNFPKSSFNYLFLKAEHGRTEAKSILSFILDKFRKVKMLQQLKREKCATIISKKYKSIKIVSFNFFAKKLMNFIYLLKIWCFIILKHLNLFVLEIKLKYYSNSISATHVINSFNLLYF